MARGGPLQGLIVAGRFLTIIPLPGVEAEWSDGLGRAGWWFPVVGAAIGAVLVAIDGLLDVSVSPAIAAVLVVACWKVSTGGIHLDGLADCLDGLGGRDAAQRRAILRDSRIGVFAALGLILCIAIEFVAIAESPARTRWRLLLLAPVLGRIAPPLLGCRFRLATPGVGLGASFAASLSRRAGPVHVCAAAALAIVLLGAPGLSLVGASIAAVFAWTAFMAGRLGGITGDVLGGSVEVGELATLLGGAVLVHAGLV